MAGGFDLSRLVQDRVDAARDELREQTQEMAQRMAERAPVDTGALRESVRTEETPEGEDILIGDQVVDYARYVNDGTRYQPAQPFVEEVLVDEAEELRDAVQDAVHRRGR